MNQEVIVKKDLNEQFAWAAKCHMKSTRYRQVELEKGIGMAQSNISAILRGKGNPTLKTISKICTAIDLPVRFEFGRPAFCVSLSDHEDRKLRYLKKKAGIKSDRQFFEHAMAVMRAVIGNE